MRRAARTDNTHREIVDALRAASVRVFGLQSVGSGMADALASYRGFTALVECKSPKGRLTPKQSQFFKEWEGAVIVATSGTEAVEKFFQAYGCAVIQPPNVRAVQGRFCQDAPVGKSCRVPKSDE